MPLKEGKSQKTISNFGKMSKAMVIKGEFVKKRNVVDDFGLKCSNISLTTMSKILKIFPIQKTFTTLATMSKIGTVAC